MPVTFVTPCGVVISELPWASQFPPRRADLEFFLAHDLAVHEDFEFAFVGSEAADFFVAAEGGGA